MLLRLMHFRMFTVASLKAPATNCISSKFCVLHVMSTLQKDQDSRKSPTGFNDEETVHYMVANIVP